MRYLKLVFLPHFIHILHFWVVVIFSLAFSLALIRRNFVFFFSIFCFSFPLVLLLILIQTNLCGERKVTKMLPICRLYFVTVAHIVFGMELFIYATTNTLVVIVWRRSYTCLMRGLVLTEAWKLFLMVFHDSF